MFDKDKELGLRLDELVPQGQEFILWSARVLDNQVQTRFGMTDNAELVLTRKGDRDRMTVTTVASAIVAKVKEQEEGDLPAICCWLKVNTSAQENVTVLRFLKPYGREEEAPAQNPGSDQTEATPSA